MDKIKIFCYIFAVNKGNNVNIYIDNSFYEFL